MNEKRKRTRGESVGGVGIGGEGIGEGGDEGVGAMIREQYTSGTQRDSPLHPEDPRGRPPTPPARTTRGNGRNLLWPRDTAILLVLFERDTHFF
ncbi:hypothetical protein M0802_016384 [Mischocyttarus mexicanus]|nr:hypothetical protein M0802_016384 [Mischocyttarus mexicanus]